MSFSKRHINPLILKARRLPVEVELSYVSSLVEGYHPRVQRFNWFNFNTILVMIVLGAMIGVLVASVSSSAQTTSLPIDNVQGLEQLIIDQIEEEGPIQQPLPEAPFSLVICKKAQSLI